MKNISSFTFESLLEQYKDALRMGYQFLTCEEYVDRKGSLPELVIVNRVDIDLSIKKADRIREIFDSIGIKGTFFVRLHANEYNPFSFENYRILKTIRDSGHEIGYHSEIVDQAVIWEEKAAECLRRDIDILNRMFDLQIKGIASHGGMTGLNNLDFWKNNKPSDFGIIYEAYDESEVFGLFNRSFYISDSEWTRWKCYANGQLCPSDQRSFSEHLRDRHSLIYLLIHPDTYFERHIYE